MKPTPQISLNQRNLRRDSHASRDHQSFPLTDYSFQSTAAGVGRSSATAEKGIAKLRTFRKLRDEFFGAEASRDYVAEALFFSVITGVSAWPIISMIAALARMGK